MNKFVIFTDSACDIKPEMLKEWGVAYESLTLRFNDESDKEYLDGSIDTNEFYQRMRGGSVAKTAAVNSATFEQSFRQKLDEGFDVLYLGFSSGLSTTYNSARIAAESLREQYPDRKIITVDTLAASAGFGLIVYLACEKKKAGATIDEVAAYVEDIQLNLSHWFTVDDLVYLKRGGRISPLAASFGNLIGIKPVLHVDNEGHLINVSKARGRKPSIQALANKIAETAMGDISEQVVFISHGDCEDEAKYLADIVREKYNPKRIEIGHVGAVIGAHSGPGTLALFFLGNER